MTAYNFNTQDNAERFW